MRSPVLLVAVAALAVAAGGCTSSEAGTPRASSSAGSGAPTASQPAGPSLPPRPRSLPVDGVEPCAILTEPQRAAFGLDRPPVPSEGTTGPLKDDIGCNFRSSVQEYGTLIIPAKSLGLREYVAQLRDSPTRRVVTVGGFPAVQDGLASTTGPGNDACFVDVDVADGQMLAVQFSQVASTKPLPMETLCAKAVEVAEAALTTLQGQR